MVAGGPSEQVLVSAVAEGSVGRELAVAQLEVAGLAHVKGNRAASCDDPLALPITEGSVLSVAATAPVIDFSTVQVDVSGEKTCESRQGRWAILAFFIGT